MPVPAPFISLMVFYLAALALGAVFSRLRLPAFAGHLLAGLVLGPRLLAGSGAMETGGLVLQAAIFFLLLEAGLSSDPEPFLERPIPAAVMAAAAFVLPLALGYGAGRLMAAPPAAATVMGLVLAMSASAVGPSALAKLEICQNRTGHLATGVSAAGLYLSVAAVSGAAALGQAGSGDLPALLRSLAGAAAPFALAWLMVRFILGRISLRVTSDPRGYFVLCMAVAATLAATAHMGRTPLMAAAFLAGQAMRLETANRGILASARSRIRIIGREFLAPFFFGLIGTRAAFETVPDFWMLAGLLWLAAVCGKTAGVALPALAFGRPRADAVAGGAALAGAGAVPLAAAATLLTTAAPVGVAPPAVLPLLGGRELAALAAALLAACVTAPPLLRAIVGRTALSGERAAFFNALPDDPL